MENNKEIDAIIENDSDEDPEYIQPHIDAQNGNASVLMEAWNLLQDDIAAVPDDK